MFDDPVPELQVVRLEYQPGIVELSVHAMFVPVWASVSKFSVSGTPSAFMLPPFVSASEGCRMFDKPMATPITETAINEASGRRCVDGCRAEFDMRRG